MESLVSVVLDNLDAIITGVAVAVAFLLRRLPGTAFKIVKRLIDKTDAELDKDQ